MSADPTQIYINSNLTPEEAFNRFPELAHPVIVGWCEEVISLRKENDDLQLDAENSHESLSSHQEDVLNLVASKMEHVSHPCLSAFSRKLLIDEIRTSLLEILNE